MKEHAAPSNSPSRSLDPREERISRRLALVGEGPASFFRDACRIMVSEGMETQTHLVAHCVREIESALRSVLRAVVEVTEGDQKKKHRAEITSILNALEFAPDDPVSTSWLDLVDREQYGLHKLAHRDSLRAPRRMNKDFEQFWNRILNVLDAVTSKIEDRFLHWLPRLDQLVAKEHPTQEDATFVLNQVPNNNVTLGHFFDQLSNPEWIDPLHQEGFFQDPPPAEREGDYIRFPPWPESRYLAKVAGSAADRVLEIALALPDTDNVRVFEDLTDAALQMPAETAAQMVPKVKEWARSSFHLVLPDKLGRLISHLALGGQAKEALDLASVALEVVPDPRYGAPETEDAGILSRSPEPKGHFDDWDYGRILECLPALVDADGLGTLDLVTALLAKAIDLSLRDGGEDQRDLSYVWRPAIEDHDQNMPHGVKHLLADAVRDVAVLVASRDEASLRSVIRSLEDQRYSTFKRIALHVLRVVPSAPRDLLAERITNEDSVDDSSIHHEFWLLTRDRLGDLDEQDQTQVFDLIDRGPDRSTLKADLAKWEGESVSDEDVERYVDNWKLRRLTIMEGTLPPSLAESLNTLRQDRDSPEHPEFLSYMGELKTGPNSPVDDAYLRGLDTDKLIEFLKEWKPTGDWMGPSPEGLGRHLESIVSQDPERFAQDAERFRDLDPTYVRGLISGLEHAHKEHKPFPWEGVLALCQWVVDQPRELPGRRGEYVDLDPGWVWTRKSIASLLSEGFGAGAAEIPFALRKEAWSVLLPITNDEDPTPEHEARYGGDNMDPSTLSINSTRGEAMHAVVRYGLWVHRHLKASGKDEADLGLDEMPELREVLDAHLDPDRDPSLAIRSVYGQWFPWLILIDRHWAQERAGTVFPRDESLAELRDAAWGAYIWRCRPYDSSFEVLSSQYADAIDRIASREKAERDRMDPDENLAEHVMTYFWQGKLDLEDPENLLGRFYVTAPPELRAHALEFVGRSIRNAGEDVEGELLDRVMRLWEWRLVEAAKADPNARRTELAAYGWWFGAQSFPEDWAIAQLERALSVGGEIEAEHLVAERLAAIAEKHPRSAMTCMRRMAEADKEGWGIIGWRDELRAAISTALASGEVEARNEAEGLVNYLGARGHLEFRDLLLVSQMPNTDEPGLPEDP